MSLDVAEQEIRQDYTSEGRKKLPAITGIRGIAACWVMIYHCFGFLTMPDWRSFRDMPLVGRGYLGVDLFFILSGFVLFLTYSRRLRTFSAAETAKFALGRMFRIFPLHLLLMVGFGLVFVATNGDWLVREFGPYNARTYLLAVFLVQSWTGFPKVWNSPVWSLSCELVAYLVFPLAVLAVWRVRSRWLAIAVALVALVIPVIVRTISHQPGYEYVTWGDNIRCLMEFLAGMLLCRLMALQQFAPREANVLFLAGLAILGIAMIDVRLDGVVPVAFSLIILGCAIATPLANLVLGNRVCHWLGQISYSIFVIHFLLLEVAYRLAHIYFPASEPARIGLTGLAVLAVLPAAHLSWRFVEVPGQALGRVVIARGYKRFPIEQQASFPG